MSQTGVLDCVGPQEVRSGLHVICTAILEVRERQECVADQYIRLARVPGGQIWTKYDLHCNLGSLREARTCRRPVY